MCEESKYGKLDDNYVSPTDDMYNNMYRYLFGESPIPKTGYGTSPVKDAYWVGISGGGEHAYVRLPYDPPKQSYESRVNSVVSYARRQQKNLLQMRKNKIIEEKYLEFNWKACREWE